ncbi:TRAP transporter substrate-binding protein DctP [Fodinicurvata sp. EGI_FJ10296]|uniref:TRAP transporter substrate-binding protein DctP n=1 Tax=Fodinicurvata sp. EGI_FJ10296 TaxID=3231908 RepID=UPI0034546B7B
MKLGLAIGVGVAAFAVTGTAVATETLRFGHVYTTDRRDHQCAETFASRIFDRTEERYQIDVYPSSQLGGEGELHEGLALGSVDLAIVSAPFMAAAYAPISLESAAFAFEDYDHWMRYAESDLREELADGYFEAVGNKIASVHYQGAWHVLSEEPIETPDDMAGLRMRVPDAEPWLVFPRAVGAEAAPIAYAEAYLALQQGVVDIIDQGLAGAMTMQFHEVRPVINMTGHLAIAAHTVIGAPLWNRLSEEDQEIFIEAAQETAAECSNLVYEDEAALLEEFEALGVTLVEVQRELFVEAVEEYFAENDVGWTEDQYARLQELR